ncbi:MAG: aldehyde dehydrogenase family protein [Deltaproteobacteria bacterium]|nr:aldehyde dehydrogenase family protein [Deltaproteobacteria bacterium]
MKYEPILRELGFSAQELTAGSMAVRTPIDGSVVAQLREDTPAEIEAKIARARESFLKWRTVPAPRRGELIRLFGNELRASREALGRLVTLESSKILAEGVGEVQEMIDICDFACGLSRQLYGLTIVSERPGHRMQETWHPLGPVGVISAFNFPVAVWAWNFALAIVCGDPVLWKPSEKSPLCALACQKIWQRALAAFGDAPAGLSEIIIGGRAAGEQLVDDPRVPLVSATGSCRMGRAVGQRVAARMGRSLLELGGNNAVIVAPSADLRLAERGILFSTVGTSGQRCTTLRRLIVHESIHDELVARLERSFSSVRIGDPLDEASLMGPLVDGAAFEAMQEALQMAVNEGGRISPAANGGRVLQDDFPGGYYVRPAIVLMPGQTKSMREETFAPILYVLKYTRLEEAIAIQNDVPQGLSSGIFTNDMREAEHFMSAEGSDCGLANINIGPSGAEIGGAFGGEKDTGGGREAGSDAWKNYMRRATNTINYSPDLPLAQGISFGEE